MYLNYKDRVSNYWVIDIETDSLDPTIVWVAVTRNVGTGETREFYSKKEFNDWQKENPAVTFIGHNVIRFDIPVLNKLWDARIEPTSCIDTMVLSWLYHVKIDGGHSLDAWGARLRFPKTDHSDWSKLTPEMVKYCHNDVLLAEKLFLALTERMQKMGFSELSCEIEHKTAVIIKEQEENGFYFDKARAELFRDELRREQANLSERIKKLFPKRRTKVAEYRFRRTKDGSPFASYEKHRAKYSDIVHVEIDGEEWYECYELVPFNIGSPKQRVERFLELGWEPTEFTDAGNPKVNEDEILKFSESIEDETKREPLRALAEWLVVSARLTMLAGNPETGSLGWLGHVRDDTKEGDHQSPRDTRIHGVVFSCGAGSRRMTHNSPNTANVPSPHKAKYGYEMRSLWGVRPGMGLIEVGVDASGLENVGLLHYLPDRHRAAAQALLGQSKPNDVHSLNARRLSEALGRPIDREWGAKTSYYAALYGAYPPKLGQIVRGDKKDGQIVQDIIINSIPGLKELNDECQYEWRTESGRMATVDGGFVVCPSQSAALNYRIQSLGAIVMKLAAILLKEKVKSEGIDYKLVGFIHDELQMETREEYGIRLGEIAVSCISEAARRLNFKVPLTGAFITGKTWGDCH